MPFRDLFEAAADDEPARIQELLGNGVEVDIVNHGGYTALLYVLSAVVGVKLRETERKRERMLTPISVRNPALANGHSFSSNACVHLLLPTRIALTMCLSMQRRLGRPGP